MDNYFINPQSLIMLHDVAGISGGRQSWKEPIKGFHLPTAPRQWRELPEELLRPVMVVVTMRWMFTMFNN